MSRASYNHDELREEDEDYDIVSFEDLSDKSAGSKIDLFALNDNINYRLCYDKDKKSADRQIKHVEQSETSFDVHKNLSTLEQRSLSINPSEQTRSKTGRRALSNIVFNATSNAFIGDNRYRRFSKRPSPLWRFCGIWPISIALCFLLLSMVSFVIVKEWPQGLYHRAKFINQWIAHAEKSLISNPGHIKKIQNHSHHGYNNMDAKKLFSASQNTSNSSELYHNSYTDRPTEIATDVCAQTTENLRFDCFPQSGSNKEDCMKRGCCWNSDVDKGPYCFYPPQYDTFRFVNMTQNKHAITVFYEKARASGYPDDFEFARFDFKYLSNDVLQIKISDPNHKRFEPPYPELPMVPGPISDMKYSVQVESTSVGFKIVRNSDNVTIINAEDVGGLILSNKFLQISAILPTNHLFGLGEKRARFMNDMNWRTFTLFNSDTKPVENKNLYGTQPMYLAVEPDGNSHGLVLLNSNAIDVVLQPTPAITFRAIGGVLNFFVFMGPSPKEVVAQYTALVGQPFMPPYWALGFHLCKFNYGSLNVTRDVWQKNRDAGIPFDVQWNDLDYMNNSNDFTYDQAKFTGLPQFVDKLHREGMHYMVLIDPGISASEGAGQYPPFDRGLDLDIFVKNSTNQPFVGKVWNKRSTVFPDFTHPSSTAYWVEMMSALHKKVQFDGAWIDMNEPSNFLSGSMYGKCAPENLPYSPYMIGDGLRTRTLCMEAKHYAGEHYDWHNMYALTEAIATHFALTELRGKRPFIISRATFIGMGHYSGHWSGDISSDWHDMRMTIPELLNFNLFGIPMMGADICGFSGDTTPELCKRWMQLGAFYPFSRNHNSDSSRPQDPVSLGTEVVGASVRALRLRYLLLPYYYTLFWRAHTQGETVARPLLFETPNDPIAHSIDEQFLIGPYIMVSPILEQGTSRVKAYFPPPQRWYNIRDGQYIGVNSWNVIDENQTVAVKGGAIIPLQEPPASGPVTTTNSRSGPMQLLVVPDKDGNGRGELYWDDGDSLNSYEERKYSHIQFTLKHTELRTSVQWWGYGVPSLNNVTILNQLYMVKAVTINDNPCRRPQCEFSYVPQSQVLQIYNLNLSLDTPFTVKWTYKHNNIVKKLNSGLNSVKLANNSVIICKNNDCKV